MPIGPHTSQWIQSTMCLAFPLSPVFRSLHCLPCTHVLQTQISCLSSVRYGAPRAPKNVGPRPNSLPCPAEWSGAGGVFLLFPAPAPGPTCSPDGSPLKQVSRNGAGSGNEQGPAPDGRTSGVIPKIPPAASCKGRALRVKTRPAPPCNELYVCPSSIFAKL